MNEFISLLLITLIFIILDLFWFSWSVERIYKPTFSAIQGSPLDLRIAGGLVAWFLLAVGIKYFVLTDGDTSISTFYRGALLGLVIYGVYNGTNYATFTKYPIETCIYDTLWGTFAVGTVSVIASKLF